MIIFRFLKMSKLRLITIFIIGLSIIGILYSCSKKAHYEKLVSEGLESGVRHDTLFLGLTLGMSSKDFYSQCWELNKQGKIRQGSGNTSVLYELINELKSPVDVNFYPTYFEDKIYEMPVKFQYKSWAPWNKQFSSDTLQVELVKLFESWYGGSFIELKNEVKSDVYIKIDGNRRISIYRDPGHEGAVWALYTDMSVDEKAKQQRNETAE